MALIVSTWMWGKKYTGTYIARLQYGVRKHFRHVHRFLVFNPLPGDEALLPGCMVRLRMFSPAFQRANGIEPGDTVVNLDLDLIVVDTLDPIFYHNKPLIILSGANASNPCPFNGSVIGFRAGEDNADLWADFNLDAARSIPRFEFPDDQGWIHIRRPDAATWQCGPSSGIYAFRKPGWPIGDKLPADARVVCFPGKRDPSQFAYLPWIKEHWR